MLFPRIPTSELMINSHLWFLFTREELCIHIRIQTWISWFVAKRSIQLNYVDKLIVLSNFDYNYKHVCCTHRGSRTHIDVPSRFWRPLHYRYARCVSWTPIRNRTWICSLEDYCIIRYAIRANMPSIRESNPFRYDRQSYILTIWPMDVKIKIPT